MDRTPRYLAAIYHLAREEGEPIPPGRVAETLDRSPSAATEMVQRLESDGLVEREPYDGVRLTDAGRECAAQRYRTYRTLRAFFEEVLRLDAPEHEAFELVGAVSPTVADRLEETLLGGDEGEFATEIGSKNE